MSLPIRVFIVHWNRPQECIRTVQCFLEQNLLVSISVIDNASSQENVKILSENLPPNVKLVRLEENKGWGGGLNVLLRQWLANKNEPYCFISAHDALPQGKCLNMLINSLESDSKLGIVCPEYGNPELPGFSPIKGPHFIFTTPRPTGTVESVPFPHGTLMACRWECLKDIGLFDERYFAYGDEYDLGLRTWLYNWKVAIVWGALVVNPGSWTPSPIKTYLFTRNSLLLAYTYGGRLQAMLRIFLICINTFRLLIFPFTRKNAFFTDNFLYARFLAITNFILNRHGCPPSQLIK
jgi:N-acetylglucosaminyl-diphospho-decaprenol L-rhamnosyltransferase